MDENSIPLSVGGYSDGSRSGFFTDLDCIHRIPEMGNGDYFPLLMLFLFQILIFWSRYGIMILPFSSLLYTLVLQTRGAWFVYQSILRLGKCLVSWMSILIVSLLSIRTVSFFGSRYGSKDSPPEVYYCFTPSQSVSPLHFYSMKNSKLNYLLMLSYATSHLTFIMLMEKEMVRNEDIQ